MENSAARILGLAQTPRSKCGTLRVGPQVWDPKCSQVSYRNKDGIRNPPKWAAWITQIPTIHCKLPEEQHQTNINKVPRAEQHSEGTHKMTILKLTQGKVGCKVCPRWVRWDWRRIQAGGWQDWDESQGWQTATAPGIWYRLNSTPQLENVQDYFCTT